MIQLVKNIIFVAKRSLPALRLAALRMCLLAFVLAVVLSCSTTSGIPDDDQLFIGLTKIDYQDYEKTSNMKQHVRKLRLRWPQLQTERCSEVRIIAPRSLTDCGYGTPFLAQRTRLLSG